MEEVLSPGREKNGNGMGIRKDALEPNRVDRQTGKPPAELLYNSCNKPCQGASSVTAVPSMVLVLDLLGLSMIVTRGHIDGPFFSYGR